MRLYSKPPGLHTYCLEHILLLALTFCTYSPRLLEERQQPVILIETSIVPVESQNKSFLFTEPGLSSVSNSRLSREHDMEASTGTVFSGMART